MGGGRDREINASTCWSLLEVAFKTYFLLCLVMGILSYLVEFVSVYTANVVLLTVESLHIWTIVTSFMMPGVGSFRIINVLFNFYILYMFLPDIVPLR